jgi:pimeloyl-ACP methyl ester carboxylesterase
MAKLAVWVGSELEKGDRAKTAQDAWSKLFGPTWGKWGPEVSQMNIDNVGTMAAKTPLDIPTIGCDDIRKFSFPVLILHGERSAKTYSDMSTAMRQCKPDLSAPIVVPNATHMIHLDNSAFFNKAVLDFMQQN